MSAVRSRSFNWLMGCLVAVSLVVPTTGIAAISTGDVAGGQLALERAEDLARLPDIKTVSVSSRGDQVSFDFEVVRPPADQRAELAIAIPEGSFTTGTVKQYRRSPLGKHELSSGEMMPTVDPIGYVRGYRIGRLSFPVPRGPSTDPVVSGTVKLLFQAGNNNRQKPDSAWLDRESTGPLRATLERLVSNPADLSRFMATSPQTVPTAVKPAWNPLTSNSPFRVRIPIDKAGLYQVSAADLINAGIKLSNVKREALRLVLEGESQPLSLLGSTGPPTGAATDQDNWIFYGADNHSPYTTTNTYWLLSDPSLPSNWMAQSPVLAAGEAAERAQVFTDVRVIEQQNQPVLTKNDQFLTILGFHWAWWTWTDGRGAVPEPTPVSQPRQFNFDLQGYYVSGGNVKLSAFFYPHTWPASQPPITIRVRMNDATPVDFQIQNANEEQKDFELPAAALRESGNTAVLEIMDAGSSATANSRRTLELAFERLRVQYQRFYKAEQGQLQFQSPTPASDQSATTATHVVAYSISNTSSMQTPLIVDVTDTAPKVLTPDRVADNLVLQAREQGQHKYMLTDAATLPHAHVQAVGEEADLHKPASADYVIVSHPLFIDAMRGFAAAKRTGGHMVQVVSIQDIYDQFGGGQDTPFALRAFLHYVTSTWTGSAGAPAATYVLFVGDCTSAYRDEFRNGVINYVPSMTVGEAGGDRFASDLWFGTSFGEDLLADNMIGRFSVNNLQDLRTILQKQAEYETTPTPGPWRNTLAYVADHSDFEDPVRNVMASTVPTRFFLHRIFMSEQPWIDNYYFPLEVAEAKKSKVSPVTTAKIRDMFNEGAAMVTYFGHGSPNVWSNERIWFGGDSENSDNRMLTNRDKLAFIVNMTCNSGAIDYPMPRWNINISEDFMRIPNGGAVACYVPAGPGITNQHEKFTLQLDHALLQEQVTPLGPALALSNWRYLLHGNPPDLARMFILMGDPALQLQFSEAAAADRELGPVASGQFQRISTGKELFDASEITTLSQAVANLLEQTTSPAEDASTWLAVMPEQIEATLKSGAVPVPGGGGLKIEEVRQDPNGVVAPGSQVEFGFLLSNNSKATPATGRLELYAGEKLVANSGRLEILPSQANWESAKVAAAAGLTHLHCFVKTAERKIELETQQPLVVLSRADASQVGQSLIIDSETVQTRYGLAASGYNANVGFSTYNFSGQPVSGAVASFMEGDSCITSVPLSTVAPGGSALTNTSIALTTQSAHRLNIRLTSGPLEFRQPTPVQLSISADEVPDLTIPADGVSFGPLSPSDGDTVFFDVTVENNGGTIAEGVQVEGTFSSASTSGTQRLESRISHMAETYKLAPHSRRTFPIRWDPFHNAGLQHVQFKVSSAVSADRNPTNNMQSVDLKVRTKAKIRRGPIRIIPQSEEDRQKLQIRIAATLYNDGESDSQGIKVSFYRTAKQSPGEFLGSEILAVLPALSSQEVMLTYKLRPEDQGREFNPSYEPVIKGSLQRIPLAAER